MLSATAKSDMSATTSSPSAENTPAQIVAAAALSPRTRSISSPGGLS